MSKTSSESTVDGFLISFSQTTLIHQRENKNLLKRPKSQLDSFLSMLCSRKMISPTGLERRESGQNLSNLVTEHLDAFAVTYDLRRFFCTPYILGLARS
jgi:hypothetical protein